jgi:WD40 repeat protein
MIVNLHDPDIIRIPNAHVPLVRYIAAVGSNVLTGSADGSWKLFQHNSVDRTLEVVSAGLLSGGEIKAVALSQADTGKALIACGSVGKYVDLFTSETLLTLTGHSDSVRACAIQNNRAITGSFDMTARVWNLTDGQLICRLSGHYWFILDVALSEDASRAFTCSLDRSLVVWDSEHGNKLYELPVSNEAISHISVSKTARFLLTGSDGHEITLFDLNHGDAMRLLALSSARHSRLGKISEARCLAEDVLRIIASFLLH